MNNGIHRVKELFNGNQICEFYETSAMIPRMLYYQERDWTCIIACPRSICSSIRELGTENEIIEEYKLAPGPRYSRDIKNLGILEEYQARYGCDEYENIKNIGFLYELLKERWYVMVEGMLNYDHWQVLCGYFPNNTYETENQTILLYDPYYNELRQFRADEFYNMWISGEYNKNHIKKDFIAVK